MTAPDPRFAGADPLAMLMVQMMYGNTRWAAEELLGLHDDPSPSKEMESCELSSSQRLHSHLSGQQAP